MVKRLLAFALVLFVGIVLFAADGDSYRFLLFGDTHFDRLDCRTEEALKHNKHEQEMKRNLASWAENGPSRRMLAKAAAFVGADMPCAIQVGDFTQGDAGSAGMAAKMQAAYMETIHSYLKLPFIPVMGNHDLRGKGAEGQARKFLPQLWNAELKLTPPMGSNPYSSFAWHHGPDVFIFLENIRLARADSRKPENAPLTERYPAYGALVKLLEENPAQRYTFVVCHFPILPVSSANPRQIPFGSKKDDAARKDLLKRLCQRQAIVLCGHIHSNTFVEYTCPEGRVSQLTVISLFSKTAAKYHQEKLTLGNLAAYLSRPVLRELLKKDADARAFINEYRGGIRRFGMLKGAGFNVVRVTPEGVFNDFHDPEPDGRPQTICLRKAEKVPVDVKKAPAETSEKTSGEEADDRK